MEICNSFKESKLDSSFVPMRNSLFLTLAANRAYVIGADTLITGVTAADYAEYAGISWQWLGGFIDADGCFCFANGNKPVLSICQKDPDILRRIGEFIKKEEPNAKFSICRIENGSELHIGTRTLRLIAKHLIPNIHVPHRRNQASFKGVEMFEEDNLCDAYVTGFWEGDGSFDSRFVKQPSKLNPDNLTPTTRIQFFQKDRAILDRISSYWGRGQNSIRLMNKNQPSPVYCLPITDGAYSGKLRKRLIPHLNCIRSFAKFDKALLKLGILSEGFNPPYPDCSPNFIWSIERTINESIRNQDSRYINIETPLMYLTKSEAVHLAYKTPGAWEALAYSHTSYDGMYPPTDMNHANVLRADGFEKAGLPDPLVIRAWNAGLMELPLTDNYNISRNLL